MKRSLVTIFLLLAFSFSPVKGQWVRTNMLPTNPFVFSFAASGENIYVGCDSGRIFRSSDNGISWALANSGIEGLNIWALAAKGDNVFAGSNAGFFVSTDKGTSWQRASDLATAHTLAIKGDSLFAGTESDGYFLSTDNGQNWSQHFAGNRVYAFLFEEQGFYAGNFVTIDNGKSWVLSNAGMENDNIYSLIKSEQDIFAGGNSGVYRWDNFDSKWFLTTLSGTGNALAFAEKGSALFAATLEMGIFLSTDNGTNWITINPHQSTYWEVYSIMISGNTILAGTRDGIWRRPLSDFGWSDVKGSFNPSEIQISPNPATSLLTIHNAPENLVNISIMNVLGQIVLELPSLHASDFTIDISKLPPGMYYARVLAGVRWRLGK